MTIAQSQLSSSKTFLPNGPQSENSSTPHLLPPSPADRSRWPNIDPPWVLRRETPVFVDTRVSLNYRSSRIEICPDK